MRICCTCARVENRRKGKLMHKKKRGRPPRAVGWLESEVASRLTGMMELSYRRHRFRRLSSGMPSGSTCALHAQLPRRRGSPCRARARHLLRNCPELGAQVRTGDCAAATAAVLARATDGTWTRWRSVTYVSGPHNRLTGGGGSLERTRLCSANREKYRELPELCSKHT